VKEREDALNLRACPSSSSSIGPTTTPLTTMGFALMAPLSGRVQSSFGLIGEAPK